MELIDKTTKNTTNPYKTQKVIKIILRTNSAKNVKTTHQKLKHLIRFIYAWIAENDIVIMGTKWQGIRKRYVKRAKYQLFKKFCNSK